MVVGSGIDLSRIETSLKPGPVALVRSEDDIDLAPSVEHCFRLGFPNVFVIGKAACTRVAEAGFLEVDLDTAFSAVINALMETLAGRWIYHGYNAEYLMFPFSEDRSVLDALQFVEEERRTSVFCTTVDLYPELPEQSDDSFDLENAYFDTAGYYSLDRYEGPTKLERQFDIFGGLKWRFSEHVQWERQRIDRIALFKAQTGLEMNDKGLFNIDEMNTMTCPWHHNLTACVASFRVAKSLMNNPGSRLEIEAFRWSQSEKFSWSSTQLMEHGFMEPGQWF